MIATPEVARYLNLPKSKVYYLVQQRRLPHINIGRNVRLRERDIQLWLEANSIAAPKQ